VAAADLGERTSESSAAEVESEVAVEETNSGSRRLQHTRRDRGRFDEASDAERELRRTREEQSDDHDGDREGRAERGAEESIRREEAGLVHGFRRTRTDDRRQDDQRKEDQESADDVRFRRRESEGFEDGTGDLVEANRRKDGPREPDEVDQAEDEAAPPSGARGAEHGEDDREIDECTQNPSSEAAAADVLDASVLDAAF
jgi:hypothetical protein